MKQIKNYFDFNKKPISYISEGLSNLETIVSDTTIYPNRPAYKATFLDNNNNKYEADILKEEGDLSLYLKTVIEDKLTSDEFSKLIELIGNYGQVKYEIGSEDIDYS